MVRKERSIRGRGRGRGVVWGMKMLLSISIIIMLSLNSFALESSPKVKVAFLYPSTYNDSYKAEWEFYDYLQKSGIESFIIDAGAFAVRNRRSLEELDTLLSQCHVLIVNTPHEGVEHVSDEHREYAKVLSKALDKFMQKGGGVFYQGTQSRYPKSGDTEYWNLITKPFGVKVLEEACIDTTREYRAPLIDVEVPFWFTQNISEHQVTDGVTSLYLPFYDFSGRPGLPALTYSPEWDILVKGEKEAKSYPAQAEGIRTHFNQEGTYTSAPPVLAVREYAQGRMVSYPLVALHWLYNMNNQFWKNTVESVGDPKSGRSSQSQKMIVNALKWLAEPAIQNPALGTYVATPYTKVSFPEVTNWRGSDGILARSDADQVEGIIGVRTAYSGGTGSVEEYVAAAREAGLSFIVFNEHLEHMTAEKLEQLKEECRAASDESFYACPGVEYTDEIGCRWAMWREHIDFPTAVHTEGGKEYINWDGERVMHRGLYVINNRFCSNIVVDYGELRKAGSRPENMWWCWQYAPEVYEIVEGRAVKRADNVTTLLRDLGNMYYAAMVSYTKVDSPDEVAVAAQTMTTRFKDLATAKKLLNQGNNFYDAPDAMEYASSGPTIVSWNVVNAQMEENWRYTRGAQRVQCLFDVRSDVGIKEVKVHDADNGPFRHYYPNGEKTFKRKFELVQGKQHYLMLEVIDMNGKKAFSWYYRIYCYKDGLQRCGDNLNTLGSAGLVWYPDRFWMMPQSKDFLNGRLFTLRGFDTSGSICPQPKTDHPSAQINIEGYGWYPDRAKEKAGNADYKVVRMASQNIQIVDMVIDGLGELYGTATRFSPAASSPPRVVAENEYYERHDRLYSLQDRADHFIIWNYRRMREGLEEYKGGLTWYEGVIKFKKDVTLQGEIPIPIVPFKTPYSVEKGWGTDIVAVGPNGMYTKKVDELFGKGAQQVKAGGFVSVYPTYLGEMAFLAPKGSDYFFRLKKDKESTRLEIGIGHDGQKFKAGDTVSFKFAVATIANITEDPVKGVQQVAQQLNIGGGRDGYLVDMHCGTLLDTEFFFTADAYGNECSFDAGPAGVMPTDLAFRIKNIADNGCAAVYTAKRPWFRFVPVFEDTAYFQENIDTQNSIWAGNIFVADDKDVRITVTVDGLLQGEKPKMELHNPTYRAIFATVQSPIGTPRFGGTRFQVKIPAGESVIMEIPEKSKIERRTEVPVVLPTGVLHKWNFEKEGDDCYGRGVVDGKFARIPGMVSRVSGEGANGTTSSLKVSVIVPEGEKWYSWTSGVVGVSDRVAPAGVSATVSFYAKHLSGSRALALSRLGGGGGVAAVELTPEWKKYSVRLTAQSDIRELIFAPILDVRHKEGQPTVGGSFLIDEITFEVEK